MRSEKMESDGYQNDGFAYKNGVAQEIKSMTLSEDQLNAIDFVMDFVKNNHSDKYKVIGGVAGSGKSTIIPHIIEQCNKTTSGWVSVCAYTGKAVMNLKRKGVTDAITLHSFLYDTRFEDDPETGGKKVIYTPKPLYHYHDNILLIVDEASMVSKDMFDLISSLPIKTVYIGDHFQLPPVNDQFNIMANPDFKLERIHRQEEGNPIVQLADLARHGKPLPLGVFGTSKHTRSFKKEDLVKYDEIITWTNSTKDAANNAVRALKGFPADIPQNGDKMIVKVNNRSKSVYNGQIVYLVAPPMPYREWGAKGWRVQFIDELAHNNPVIAAMTNSATRAIASVHLPKAELDRLRTMKQPFTKSEIIKMKRDNPYQVHLDWGYAITCHAAQGTSWRNVAVLLEDRMKAFDNEEKSRWIYTAITRAEESVTIYSGDFNNL